MNDDSHLTLETLTRCRKVLSFSQFRLSGASRSRQGVSGPANERAGMWVVTNQRPGLCHDGCDVTSVALCHVMRCDTW